MPLSFLSLNCQKAYNPGLKHYLDLVLQSEKYDFILLQEATPEVTGEMGKYSDYKILNHFDPDLGSVSHVCIVYRKNFELENSFLVSFAKVDTDRFPHGWGALFGIFVCNNHKYTIGSIHLRSGLARRMRSREIKEIKDNIKDYRNIIFGGDFNTGLPGEVSAVKKILSPEFDHPSIDIGPTLDSRYTEQAPFILNRLATFLAKLNIGFKYPTDHFFIKGENVSVCKRLPDRVSDHSPIELILQ